MFLVKDKIPVANKNIIQMVATFLSTLIGAVSGLGHWWLHGFFHLFGSHRIGVISLLALCPQLKIVNFLLHFCGEFWNLFGNFLVTLGDFMVCWIYLDLMRGSNRPLSWKLAFRLHPNAIKSFNWRQVHSPKHIIVSQNDVTFRFKRGFEDFSSLLSSCSQWKRIC